MTITIPDTIPDVSVMDDEQKLVRYQAIVDTLDQATPSAPHVIDLVTFEPRLEASGVALVRRTPTP